MKNRRLICFLAALVLVLSCLASASALSSSTLSIGSRGEEVRKLQQALIDLGYLKGKADGIFGKQTYQAVCNFQTARKLTVDGLAGKKTQSVLYDAASSAKAASTEKTDTSAASDTSSSSAASTSSASSGSVSSGNLFSGNYATLRLSDRGDRVKIMQQALIRLNYLSGKADGIFGNKTLDAVVAFQKAYSLTADGLAGKKTLKALESADKDGTKKGTASTPVSIEEESAPAKTSASASVSSFLSRLLIYDPSTGISWTLRVHSCGRQVIGAGHFQGNLDKLPDRFNDIDQLLLTNRSGFSWSAFRRSGTSTARGWSPGWKRRTSDRSAWFRTYPAGSAHRDVR